MKYLESMLSKYGFNDGDELPLEARALRRVYVAVLNSAAQRKGSEFRALCYDRPGLHNSCMILFVREADFKSTIPEKMQIPALWGEWSFQGNIPSVPYVKTDGAFHKAFTLASDMDPPLSELVEVVVNVDYQELKKTVNAIRRGELG